MRAHRVLERAAVDLDRVGRAAGEAAREDRRTHHEVVRERDVGRSGRPARPLRWRRGNAPARHRSAPRRASRRSPRSGRPRTPAARRPMSGLWTVTPSGGVPVAVLAEQVDLVPEAREGAHQAGVVDVAAGAPEQVAVEDQDAHRRWIFPGYRQLSFRAHARPPEVSPARPLGPRDHPRGRAGQAVRRPRERRGAQGRRARCCRWRPRRATCPTRSRTCACAGAPSSSSSRRT